MLSYPISSKPTKIKHFSHFTTQKSNSNPTKNSPIIPKFLLFIGTFTDNDFSSKNHSTYHLRNLTIWGYSKTISTNHNHCIKQPIYTAKIFIHLIRHLIAQISHFNSYPSSSPLTQQKSFLVAFYNIK